MKTSSFRNWTDLDAWLAGVEHVLKENAKVRRKVTYDVRAAVRMIEREGA